MAERFKISRRSTSNSESINNEPNSFARFDKAMNAYYISVGHHNYFEKNKNNAKKRQNKNGKFSMYCKINGIDIDDIADELKYDPLDCLLVDFDDKFPFHPSHSIQTKNDQTLIKYNIIKYCYENGIAPIFEFNDNNKLKCKSPSPDDKLTPSPTPPNPLDHKVYIYHILLLSK